MIKREGLTVLLLAHDKELVEGALLLVDKHRQVIEVEACLLT